eukprot:scaffold6356_cov118-Isochrysis_galbana.AAC.2
MAKPTLIATRSLSCSKSCPWVELLDCCRIFVGAEQLIPPHDDVAIVVHKGLVVYVVIGGGSKP